MLILLEYVISFFFENPGSLIFLAAGLIYLEYLVAQNIIKDNGYIVRQVKNIVAYVNKPPKHAKQWTRVFGYVIMTLRYYGQNLGIGKIKTGDSQK